MCANAVLSTVSVAVINCLVAAALPQIAECHLLAANAVADVGVLECDRPHIYANKVTGQYCGYFQ